MKVEKNNLKSVLIDFLRFGIWQIQNDKCNYEQMRSYTQLWQRRRKQRTPHR